MDNIITQEILEGIGVRPPEGSEAEFLAHANSQLKERIGLAIAEELDDNQLVKLREFTAAGGGASLQEWLKATVPELDEIIDDEVDIFLGDLAKNATSF